MKENCYHFLLGKQTKTSQMKIAEVIYSELGELGVATCVLGEESKEDCGRSEKVPSWAFLV